MNLTFSKMQSLGNDFIIVNSQILSSNKLKTLTNRNYGIGCDQLAILKPSNSANIYMQIFNADGGEVEACGNMTRCVARLLFEGVVGGKASEPSGTVTIETKAGVLTATCVDPVKHLYRVNMGRAVIDTNVPLPGNPVAVNVGNPHCVFFVDDLSSVDLEKQGAAIENHPYFPQKTNVEFVEVVDRKTVRALVWERGVGQTLACGTGACAIAAAAVQLNKTDKDVTVRFGDNALTIEIGETIFMTGDAVRVFDGVYYDE